ncbi:hypothetical protein NC651_033862 [Populus alba x Populus x berolinensis]|nr:hypothetical protein NC651_033862 [Populus alba x Populus x berolinensis]
MDISGGLGMLPQLDGSDAYFTVSDLISASHNWDFRVLRTPIPQFIQDTIHACPRSRLCSVPVRFFLLNQLTNG